jgi:predicted kinase
MREGGGRESLPALIVVSGRAGSGKSTLARALSRRMHIACVDYDTASEPFIRAVLERDGKRDFSAYAKAFRETAYKVVLDVGFENLASGVDVIVSGPFGKESTEAGYFARLSQQYGCSFKSVVLEIVVTEGVLKKRITERRSDRDARKIEQWDDFMASTEMQKRAWSPDVRIEVDETGDADLDTIVTRLERELKTVIQ